LTYSRLKDGQEVKVPGAKKPESKGEKGEGRKGEKK
jgi:hypothetical protein